MSHHRTTLFYSPLTFLPRNVAHRSKVTRFRRQSSTVLRIFICIYVCVCVCVVYGSAVHVLPWCTGETRSSATWNFGVRANGTRGRKLSPIQGGCCVWNVKARTEHEKVCFFFFSFCILFPSFLFFSLFFFSFFFLFLPNPLCTIVFVCPWVVLGIFVKTQYVRIRIPHLNKCYAITKKRKD